MHSFPFLLVPQQRIVTSHSLSLTWALVLTFTSSVYCKFHTISLMAPPTFYPCTPRRLHTCLVATRALPAAALGLLAQSVIIFMKADSKSNCPA